MHSKCFYEKVEVDNVATTKAKQNKMKDIHNIIKVQMCPTCNHTQCVCHDKLCLKSAFWLLFSGKQAYVRTSFGEPTICLCIPLLENLLEGYVSKIPTMPFYSAGVENATISNSLRFQVYFVRAGSRESLNFRNYMPNSLFHPKWSRQLLVAWKAGRLKNLTVPVDVGEFQRELPVNRFYYVGNQLETIRFS